MNGNSRILGDLKSCVHGGVMLLALGNAACTDETFSAGSVASEAPPEASTGDSEYSIKALIGPQGDQRLVSFEPLDYKKSFRGWPSTFPSDAMPADEQSAGDLKEKVLREQAVIRGDDGVERDTNVLDEFYGIQPGATLLSYAAKACSQELDLEVGDPTARPPMLVSRYPWELGNGYYGHQILPHRNNDVQDNFQTCDVQLAAQEVLLCAADRLAELADSVGTVHWDINYQPLTGAPETIQVTIPPQATQDRFIARDMALNTLAAVAQLDLRHPGGAVWPAPPFVGNPDQTDTDCTKAYALAADGDDSMDPNDTEYDHDVDGVWEIGEFHFGVDPYAPNNAFVEAGKQRLRLKSNVLAAASRLVQKLVTDSVRDDLAGAEKARANAGDPSDGARAYWGAPDAEEPFYNTIRHALRVLYGRLEISTIDPDHDSPKWQSGGILNADPMCWGAPNYGYDAVFIGARANPWDDPAVTTPEQSKLLSMLERSGVVVPLSAIGSDLTDEISKHLMRQAAVDAQVIADASEFDAWFAEEPNEMRDAMAEAVADLESEDVALALRKNFYTFRLMTERYLDEDTTGADLVTVAESLGFSIEASADVPEITALTGIVVQDGLSRGDLGDDLSRDVVAYSVGSQCGRALNANETPHGSLSPQYGWNLSHQSAFDLGQVLGRRLGMLRDLTEEVNDEIHDFASVATAEVRGWAGPGQIYFEVNGGIDQVTLTGFKLADFGVDTVAELQSLIVRVPDLAGANALMVKCLAGARREHCRAPTASDFVESPQNASIVNALLTDDVKLGLDGDVIELRFSAASHIRQYYYLIVKGQEAINGGKGRVLAVLGNPRAGLPNTGLLRHAVAVSDYRRDLTRSLFDSTVRVGGSRTCNNLTLGSTPQSYCLEGMQRDAFVPLANEITTEGTGFEDSWRHYLRVAEEAAATADELGRQLIEVGIQRDIRQEAALEEVANLCGSFPDVDGVGAGNGAVEPSDDDSETNACLSGETTDVVFIGEDPFQWKADGAVLSASEADLLIRVFYCLGDETIADDGIDITGRANDGATVGGDPTDPTFCAKSRAACRGDDSECITHAGLGFVERATLPEVRPLTDVCGGLLKVEQFYELDGTVYDESLLLSTVRGQIWSNESGLMAAANSYRLVETLDGDWALYLEDEPILANLGMVSGLSAEARAELYPACAEEAGVACTQGALDVAALVLRYNGGDAVVARARAEDAIHGLAALAGEMPPSAITMPMPVANLTALATKVTGGVAPMYVPAWTVYSPSQFEESVSTPGLFDMQLPPEYAASEEWFRYTFADSEMMSGLPQLDPDFLNGRDDDSLYGAALADDYATQIMPHNDAYLVYYAANAGVQYQDDIFNEAGWIRTEGDPGPTGTRANLDSWYRSFAASLNTASRARREVAPLFHLQPGQASQLDSDGHLVAQGGLCPQDYGGPAFVQAYGTPDANGATVLAIGNYWPRVDLVQDANAFMDIDALRFGWEPFNSFLLEPTAPPQVPRQNVRSYYFRGLSPSYEIDGATERKWDWQGSAFVKLGFNPVKPNSVLTTSVSALPALIYQSPEVAVAGGILPQGYYRLSPKKCGAHQRMELALPEPDHSTVLRGLGMACLAAAGGGQASEVYAPPSGITSVNDIRKLEDWMLLVAETVNTVGGMLYLTDVPRSVVDSVAAGTVDASTVGQGVEGQIKLDIAENLRGVQAGFAHLALHVETLRSEMRATRIRLQRIELDRQAAQLAAERESLEVNRQRMVDHTQRALRETQRTFEKMTARNTMIGALGEVAAASASTVLSLGSSGGQGIASNAALAINSQLRINQIAKEEVFDHEIGRIEDDFYSKVSGLMDAQNQNNEERAQSDIQAALTDLGMDSQQAYGAILDSLTGIQNGTSDALGALNQLRLNRQAASVALMKAAGADFVELNGQEVPLHLNTVYRRQFGVLKERYQRALDSAKRAAYLARLSIEQRLGVRFDGFHEDVGPLAPPSVWVDDLCSLQGVDYDALREATPPSEGGTTESEEVDLIRGFADQYIGDYVRNLEELVEFYNLQNPFKEADDSTILSMREILGKDGESCVRLSHNLLFHSDHLEIGPASLEDGASMRGWQNSGCDEAQCLSVLPGVAISDADDDPVPPPQGVGSLTLLQTVDTEDAAETFAVTTTQYGAPAKALYQTVELSEGERYTLTWWDMARGPLGEPLAAPTEQYRATVYDEEWAPLAMVDQVPNGSAAGTDWALRKLEFTAFSDGTYHIAFAPSLPGRDANTIALANVQLEVETGAAQGYESTGAGRMVSSAICGADDPESFRRRFDYQCRGDECYYELDTLLDIDTELLNQGNSPLVGLIAAGNHNYRHVALAANVVGTGVLDCEGSPLQSCYGSGYVEYDLTHTAFNVPLIDSRGETTCFDFGGGAIRNGKALAIERFLTLPLSSADQGLISQNSLRRTQFAGRPLSGSYRLRIKDTPALVWENVEDVQLVLDYRYWSSVDTSN